MVMLSIERSLERRKKLFGFLDRSIFIIPAKTSFSDFYYFTGLEVEEAIAVFKNTNDTPEYTLFYKEPTQKEITWDGPRMGLEEIKEISGAKDVYPLEKFSTQLEALFLDTKKLYYDLGKDEKLDSILLKARGALRQKKAKPVVYPMAIVETYSLITKMRIQKDDYELSQIKKAIDITVESYRSLFDMNLIGKFEYEIEAFADYTFRKNGAQGPSFPTIVAAGANAAYLHYVKNDCRIEKEDMILLDSGAKYGNYSADITRTWPVSGKFTPAQKAVYEIVLDTQKSVIEMIRPGVKVIDLHKKSIRKITEGLLKIEILKGNIEEIIEKKEYEPFYMHTVGHWLGLDTHDLGGYYFQDEPILLQPGMILTVEPGIYIRKEFQNIPKEFCGIGVRIEDDILVTETGYQILTKAVPKEIKELENILTKK